MKDLMANPYLLFIAGTVVGTVVGFALKSMLPSNDPETCSIDFTPAKSKIISISRAEEIYRSYTNRRVPIIKQFESEDFEPTRFGEVDFGVLKNYIDYLNCIEQRIGKAIGTVRIYFANYPQQFANGDAMLYKASGGNIYPYSGRNTFFMLPTVEENGEQKGFTINDTNNDNDALEYSTISNFRTSRSDGDQENETYSLIFNEVGLTPPPPRAEDDFNT